MTEQEFISDFIINKIRDIKITYSSDKAFRVIEPLAPNYYYLLRDLTEEESHKYRVGDECYIDDLRCRVIDKNTASENTLLYAYKGL